MVSEISNELLTRQVRHEFAASHQYSAVAVRFDSQYLAQPARHFYRRFLEERNHAMLIVQYVLDRNLPLTIAGVEEASNDVTDVREPLSMALARSRRSPSRSRRCSPPPGSKGTRWGSSSCSGSSESGSRRWRR